MSLLVPMDQIVRMDMTSDSGFSPKSSPKIRPYPQKVLDRMNFGGISIRSNPINKERRTEVVSNKKFMTEAQRAAIMDRKKNTPDRRPVFKLPSETDLRSQLLSKELDKITV